MNPSAISLPASTRGSTLAGSARASKTASTIAGDTRAPTPQTDSTVFQKPSVTKVLELPEKLRARAESTADAVEHHFFEQSPGHDAIRNITKFLEQSHIRVEPETTLGKSEPESEPSDNRSLSSLSVAKRSQRQTVPPDAHGTAGRIVRTHPRMAVSAPVMPRNAERFKEKAVPRSPMGNAWSGEHYWNPQFSDTVPAWVDDFAPPHTDPGRRMVYDAVIADMATCTRELKAEAEKGGGVITDAECEVIAAMTILDERNDDYAANCEMPVPREVTDKIEEFREAQAQALATHAVRDEDGLEDSSTWLQMNPLQITTTIDNTRASMRMVKEQRKSAELQPSYQAYGLVYAVHILEDRIRRLKKTEGYEDSSDDETMEYEKFLKSVQEEHGSEVEGEGSQPQTLGRLISEGRLEKRRLKGKEDEGLQSQTEGRMVSEGGLTKRRLRGKAPSTFDLEAWAEQLKKMDPEDPAREGFEAPSKVEETVSPELRELHYLLHAHQRETIMASSSRTADESRPKYHHPPT